MKHIFMRQIDSLDLGAKREVVPIVHYAGAGGDDRTLCGTAYEEDDRYPNHDLPDYTSKRVNCEICLMIRDHVLGKRK